MLTSLNQASHHLLSTVNVDKDANRKIHPGFAVDFEDAQENSRIPQVPMK